MSIPYENLFNKLDVVLANKLEELHYHNYRAITKEDIWRFCVERKWRKKNIEEIPLHSLVNTIFRVTASELLQYEQIAQYQEIPTNLGLGLELEEIQALLTPVKLNEEP